jgi:hypothetical protein
MNTKKQLSDDEKETLESTIYLKIFKKVLETGIQKELSTSDPKIYGYRINIHNPEEEHFFSDNSKFIQLMDSRRILFKTKLTSDDIYFPIFILSEIIEKEIITYMEHPIEENYYEYLTKIEPTSKKISYGMIEIWEKMLSEPGDFWYQQCKGSDEEEGIYHFYGNRIYQYEYRNGKYYTVYFSTDRKGQVHERTIDFLEETSIKKGKHRILQSLHKSSKFYHENGPLIEYTLQDMLDYVNQLLEVDRFLEEKSKIHPELLIESKNPKYIQKYLDLGYSIEEALSSVGY